MENVKMQECTICGDEKTPGQIWFLIAESHWEDKLKVLEWRDELAKRHGIYAVCGAAHVEEMVIHWMTTGSLDYPFATVGQKRGRLALKRGSLLPVADEPDTRGSARLENWRLIQSACGGRCAKIRSRCE